MLKAGTVLGGLQFEVEGGRGETELDWVGGDVWLHEWREDIALPGLSPLWPLRRVTMPSELNAEFDQGTFAQSLDDCLGIKLRGAGRLIQERAAFEDRGVESGTLDDPYDGSTAAKFDAIMTSLSGHTDITIHLGPTASGYEFKTAGGGIGDSQSDWRIIGVGINAITLKVEDSLTGRVIVAIGNP